MSFGAFFLTYVSDAGANVLLAYWHYCNKGTYPFSKECKESELASLASLDEDEKQFVRFTREYASENSTLSPNPSLPGEIAAKFVDQH